MCIKHNIINYKKGSCDDMDIIESLAELGAVTIGIIVVLIIAFFVALFLIPAFFALVAAFVVFLFYNPIGWALLVILVAGICCCSVAGN